MGVPDQGRLTLDEKEETEPPRPKTAPELRHRTVGMVGTARAASRLLILFCVAALLAVAPASASTGSGASGPKSFVYSCTTDFHWILGPSSYPQQAAYGNGTCTQIHLVGLALKTDPLQVSWNGAGTTVCSSTPLDPVIANCSTDLSVALTDTHADGSTDIRDEIWHFPGGDPNIDPGSIVTIYDSNGRFLGDGEGSLDGSSFTWREYGSLL